MSALAEAPPQGTVSRAHKVKRDKDGYVEAVVSSAALLVEGVELELVDE